MVELLGRFFSVVLVLLLLPVDVHVQAAQCKGITRLEEDETRDNEYNMGTGWYGAGETSRGDFGANPDAFYATNYTKRNGACIPSVSTAIQCHQSKGGNRLIFLY